MYDLLLEERHLLVDVGFSHCAANGFVLATRVIPFADFVMTSGAPVGMDRGTLEAIIRLPGMREDDPDIAGLTLEARADSERGDHSVVSGGQEYGAVCLRGRGRR